MFTLGIIKEVFINLLRAYQLATIMAVTGKVCFIYALSRSGKFSVTGMKEEVRMKVFSEAHFVKTYKNPCFCICLVKLLEKFKFLFYSCPTSR